MRHHIRMCLADSIGRGSPPQVTEGKHDAAFWEMDRLASLPVSFSPSLPTSHSTSYSNMLDRLPSLPDSLSSTHVHIHSYIVIRPYRYIPGVSSPPALLRASPCVLSLYLEKSRLTRAGAHLLFCFCHFFFS